MSYMYGKTFIRKILNHERDFTGVSIQPLFDFNKDKALYLALRKYLHQYYKTFETNPLILEDAQIKGVRASNLEIPYLQASNLDLTESWLKKVKLPNSQMPYLKIWGSRLEFCEFEDSFQEGANYNDAQVISSKFIRTNLDSILCDANTKFDSCKFKNDSMKHIIAAYVYFQGSELIGVNIAYTDFYFANLKATGLIDLKGLSKSRNLDQAFLEKARLGLNEYLEIKRLKEIRELDVPLIVGKLESMSQELDDDFSSLVERTAYEKPVYYDKQPTNNSYLDSTFTDEVFQKHLAKAFDEQDTEDLDEESSIIIKI